MPRSPGTPKRVSCAVVAAVLLLLPAGANARSGSSGPVAGADLSYLPKLVAAGAEYRMDGRLMEPLEILRLHGYGVIRLRVWHTPEEAWHGTAATVSFARDVRAAGFDLLLDLHYSDTWADPGHQTRPSAWRDLGFPALVDSVREYTRRVLRRFEEEGAEARYVQIGNEISAGLLWNAGRVGWKGSAWDTPRQWARFAELLQAGIDGAREGRRPGESPEIIVHYDNGADNAGCRRFYDALVRRGIGFDIIGLSFYPWWHGTLDELKANLADLAARYGKPVMIVEAAYPWTLGWADETHNFVGRPEQLLAGYPATAEGQKRYLEDLLSLISTVPYDLGAGLCYWEPAFVPVEEGPANPCENLALFDFEGNALPGLGFATSSIERPGESE